MPPSNSSLAYRDIEEILERALANGKGIRIKCRDKGQARSLQVRSYKYRTIDRKENTKVFDLDNPMYGKSAYDQLLFTINRIKGQWYLMIEVSTAERLDDMVEELTDEEPDIVEKVVPPPIAVSKGGIVIGQKKEEVK